MTMPYETLYRRYRPRKFEEVVGQPHVVRTLTNAIRLSRFSHAYLFAGQRGTGKTTVARLLAKALNCTKGPTPEPCCECDACMAIQSGRSMDVIELDAASHTKVEQIRELIVSRVAFVPAEHRYRVFIIDEAHMLSLSSFNALLKTLEEPPPHVVFVLATTDPHKIPPTIHSRCQRFDFRPIPPQLIAERMRQIIESEQELGNLKTTVTQEALMLIANVAGGSLRDALSILEQLFLMDEGEISTEQVRSLLGMVSEDLLFELMLAISDGDVASCWRAVQSAIGEGKDLFQLVRDLMAFARELLAFHVSGYEITKPVSERIEGLKKLCERLSQEQLVRIIERLSEAEREMRISDDAHLALDIGLLRAVEDARREKLMGKPQGSEVSESQPVILESAPAIKPETDKHGLIATEDSKGEEATAEGDEKWQVWKRVLETMQSKKLTTFALLQGSELIQVNGDVLVIAVSHPFQKEYLEKPDQRRIVEDVASKVLSKNCSVRFILSEYARRMEDFAKSTFGEIDASADARGVRSELQRGTLGLLDLEGLSGSHEDNAPKPTPQNGVRDAGSEDKMKEIEQAIIEHFPGAEEIVETQ